MTSFRNSLQNTFTGGTEITQVDGALKSGPSGLEFHNFYDTELFYPRDEYNTYSRIIIADS